MIIAICRKISFFLKNDKGAILVIASLLLVPLLLMLGLAVDTSYGLAEKRKLQMACDAAAKAGGANGNGVTATITSEAQKVFNANTANMSGITGPTISANSAAQTVTVSASITVNNFFMGVGGIPTSTYSATSTAPQKISAIGCVYSLDPSASGAISLTGATRMQVSGCGVYANSTSASAVNLTGSSNITASFLTVAGNYTTSGTSTVLTTNGITTGASPAANPLGNIAIPSYSSCTYTNFTASGTQTINPGVYCNGITVNGIGNLTLNPGQYIIDGGTLNVGNSGKLTGSNVTLILTKKLGTSYATLNASGAAVITLTAPAGNTSNPFNGIAIYQDPNAPSGVTNSVGNSVNFNVTGIIAFPNQTLSFSGASFSTAPCAILIAGKLAFAGSASMNCSNNLLSTYMYAR